MTDAPGSPYKGLTPFEDSDLDALFFFGREREREIIVANVIAARLTVLYGPSGVGKSSVLNAAVARELRALPEQPVVVAFDNWSDDPVQALAAALAEAAGVDAEGTLADTAGTALARHSDVYLLLDQVEEYFTYHPEGGWLGEELGTLLGRGMRANVLLSLREEELAKLDRFKGRLPGLFGNVLRLDRLDHAAARSAIVRPVERWNELTGERVGVEEALVEAVLEDVGSGRVEEALGVRTGGERENGSGAVEAPFLQLVMQRLWDVEREAHSGELRESTLRRLGGAPRIVAHHLEGAVADFEPNQRDVVARLFHHLVTPSGTKIAHAVPDLAQYVGVGESELQPILTKLAASRILRPLDRTPGGEDRYEIFHDVLADPILAWRSRHEGERAVARERAAARRRHRRLAVIAATSLALLAVVAAIALFALAQRSQARQDARTAQARELAATALTQLPVDPELALLLAKRAVEVESTPRVEDVLREALVQSRVRDLLPLKDTARTLAAGVKRLFVVTRAELLTLDERLRTRDRNPVRGRVLGVHSGSLLTLDGKTLSMRDLETGEVQRVRIPVDEVAPVRDTELGTVIGQLRVPKVRLATVGPKRTLLAVSDRSSRVVIVNLLTGDPRYPLEQGAPVTALAFSPGSRLIAVGCADGTIRVWRVGVGTLFATLRAPKIKRITSLEFSPRGTLVAAGSSDGTARIWNVTTNSAVATLTGHTTRITDLAFSPDGFSLLTSSTDGTARVWKADTGRSLAVLRGHSEAVTAGTFTADGASVATAGADRTLRVWDAQAQRELTPLKNLRRPVTRALFVDAGHIEAVTDDGRAHELDARTGRELGVEKAKAEQRDPRAVIEGTTVRIGRDVVLRGHTRNVTSVRFSSDGARVVTASRDGDVRLWDARTGELLRTLREHLGTVAHAEFSPDGRWIVSAGPSTAGLWASDTGRLQFFLRGHEARLTSAAFDPTGTRIVTAGRDGTVRVYHCEICASGEALLDVARARLRLTGRQFTADERERFGL